MLIRQFFLSQNYLEVVLYLRGTVVGRFWPCPPPAPSQAPEARPRSNSCGERSSLLQMKKKRKQKPKRRRTEWKSRCHFFSPQKIKNSVFWLFMSFFVVFHMNAACVFFTLILFFSFVYTPPPSLPHSAPPPAKKKSSWRESIPMRSHA